MAILNIAGLTKSFPTERGDVPVLQEVNLNIPIGSFFTLLGPSGCGKTTILRCTAGLETPDDGEIRIADQVVFSSVTGREIPPERRPIGMVFQSYAIWPHMTVYDNAAYPLRYGRHRPSRSEIPKRVHNMLGRLGLDEYANRWATQLSGGQQQRLALARALLGEPKLLLLDEPLSNLDAKMRAQLRIELKTIQRETGVTTLYVTHDQTEALSMSDYIAVMESGRVLQMGTPLELYANPRSIAIARFIGSANLLESRVLPHAAGVECGFGTVRCDTQGVASPHAWICIRPEDVEVRSNASVMTEAPDVNWFAARVQTLEFLGDYREGLAQIHGVPVRLKVHRRTEIAEGQEVMLHFPPAACHLIPDPDGRIRFPSSSAPA